MNIAWSQHQVSGRVCTRLSLTLAPHYDPIKILLPAKSWAFVWKGRDEDRLLLAIDALATRRQLKGLQSDLPWYGGRAFFDQNSDTAWGELGDEFWFLPEQQWSLESDKVILSLTAFGEGQELRKELMLKAEEILGLYDSRPEPMMQAPRVLQRVDQPDRETWRENLRLAQASDLHKVVLSRSATLQLSQDANWLQWIRHLLSYREESYVFAIKTPDKRCFLGRSPERILAWGQGAFQVDAIAGTRKRGDSAHQDRAAAQELLRSEKEQSEHRYVSRFVARLLTNLRLPFQQIDDEKLLTLTHVQHMRSRFQGRFAHDVTPARLLQDLHPTPAVGGEPTQPAIAFLRAQEGYERGWYAGFIGWASDEAGECAIGIRSALLDGPTLRLFAGAGIVKDSDPEAEWEETELKMRTFLSLLETQKSPASRSQQAEFQGQR